MLNLKYFLKTIFYIFFININCVFIQVVGSLQPSKCLNRNWKTVSRCNLKSNVYIMSRNNYWFCFNHTFMEKMSPKILYKMLSQYKLNSFVNKRRNILAYMVGGHLRLLSKQWDEIIFMPRTTTLVFGLWHLNDWKPLLYPQHLKNRRIMALPPLQWTVLWSK